MTALLKKNLRAWGYGKALALFAGCLIFGISGRLNGGISYEQHLLSVVSDHYYLTYFMLPLVLLSCFSFLADDGEPVILRFHSYHAYFLQKWAGVGVIALLLVGVQSLAILLSGAGLPPGNHWTLSAGAANAELFSVLRQYFGTPAQAFAACTLYQFCGSWMLCGVCMWIGHFGGRKWPVRILAALYVLAAVWIKLPLVQDLPLTGFNHLLILHHNLTGHSRFAVTGITVLALLMCIVVSVRFAWRGKLPCRQARGRGIAAYYLRGLLTRRSLLILCAVVLGICVYKRAASPGLESGGEWIAVLFAGHGTGGFRVLSFLEMLIVNGAPLYLLAAFTSRTVIGQSLFVAVRTRGRRALLCGILSAGVSFLTVYALLWLAGGMLGATGVGRGADGPMYRLLFYAVLLKWLDTLVQYLVMLCIVMWSRQVTIGFLALLAGNLLCIVPQRWTSCLPFGLSSLSRIAGLQPGVGIPAAAALAIEALFAAGLLAWLLLCGYKKILDWED